MTLTAGGQERRLMLRHFLLLFLLLEALRPDIYMSFSELKSQFTCRLSERLFLISQCEMTTSSYSISPPSVITLRTI